MNISCCKLRKAAFCRIILPPLLYDKPMPISPVLPSRTSQRLSSLVLSGLVISETVDYENTFVVVSVFYCFKIFFKADVMTIKEYCEKYDQKFQTVYKKIAHHKHSELEGHSDC